MATSCVPCQTCSESGVLQKTLTGHLRNVFSAAFSPDGGRIVTASADQSATIDLRATQPLAQQIYSSDADARLQLISTIVLGCVGALLAIRFFRFEHQNLFLEM